MKRLRGVCIGAGYFSQFHFDAWRRIPEIEIVAVCELDQEKARRASESLGGAEICSDICEALDRHKPDFVDIITPPATHRALIEETSKRKIATICQKALAPDFRQACEIVETANRSHIPLMVHENFRFQPWHREIRKLIDNGTIGTVHHLYFRSRLGDGWGEDAYLARQPYFRDMPKLLVFETGVHFIDTFRYLAGEVEEVYAKLKRLNPVIRGEDAGILMFRFACGATGMWDANRFNESNCTDPRYTFGEFLVEGSLGSIRLYPDGRLTIQKLGKQEQEHAYVHEHRGFGGDCVYTTQRHFVDNLIAGKSFETSGDEYLKTLKVQEAVYASAAANRPIDIQDFEEGRHSASSELHVTEQKPPSRRIVDLSLPIDNDLRGVQITPFTTISGKGWNSTTLSLYSHCGTHMDAPKHFLPEENALSIDQQTLEVCCGSAKVIDLTPTEPCELLTIDRFRSSLARSGLEIQPHDRLLLRTDWSLRFGTPEYRDGLPRISLELARWFVERQVALIGVEPPSVADVNNMRELTDVHQALFRGGVVIVEGLANLHTLRKSIVEFIALPLRIVAGDGCPVRAVAME